jgi:hypothetical protein
MMQFYKKFCNLEKKNKNSEVGRKTPRPEKATKTFNDVPYSENGRL